MLPTKKSLVSDLLGFKIIVCIRMAWHDVSLFSISFRYIYVKVRIEIGKNGFSWTTHFNYP